MGPAEQEISKMSKEDERVVISETRGENRPMMFQRVEIAYADGAPFYSGWIQDFGAGDPRTGPTFFESNYERFGLEREVTHRREIYWEPRRPASQNCGIRLATSQDHDEIIDLNFQNLFDGGYNRVSAYQGMRFEFDENHDMLVWECEGGIFGFLYINFLAEPNRLEAYFDSLFCAPAVRGQGVGSSLIYAGLERAQSRGMRRVTGQITGNEPHCEGVLRLLTHHGFEVEDASQHSDVWIVVDVSRSLDEARPIIES